MLIVGGSEPVSWLELTSMTKRRADVSVVGNEPVRLAPFIDRYLHTSKSVTI